MKDLSERGFTLIELILVIGIMSFVVAAIFSFLLFENKMFNKASDKFDIQAETRLALSQMDKTLRNSVTLSLISRSTALTEIAAVTANTNYAVMSSDGTLKVYLYRTTPSNGYDIKTYGGHIVDNSASSYFQKINGNTLKVNISAVNKNETYTLDTEILMNNMTLAGGSTIANSANQMAVKFTK